MSVMKDERTMEIAKERYVASCLWMEARVTMLYAMRTPRGTKRAYKKLRAGLNRVRREAMKRVQMRLRLSV